MKRSLLSALTVLLLLPGAGWTQGRPTPQQEPNATSPTQAQQKYQKSMREAKNLVRRGQYEDALAHLDRIEEIGRSIRDYIVLRGTCLRKLGKLDQACRLYREGADARVARGEDPTSMLIELERALREKEDPVAAFAACLELHRLGGGVGIWVRDEIESLIQVDGLGERALGPLREEITARPEADDLRALYVGALYFLGRFEESLHEAILLDRSREARGLFLLEQARQMDEKGVGIPSLAMLSAAVAEGLDAEPLQEAHYLRARALRRLRRPAEAADAYQEAAAMDPKGPLTYVALRDRADLLVRDVGDIEAGAIAFEELIDALESIPQSRRGKILSQARVSLADCHLRLGRYDEASEELERAETEAIDPEPREEAAFQQAEIRFYAGQIEEARAGYDRVVEEFRGGTRVNDALERILLLTRNAETAGLPLAALGQIAYQRRVGSIDRALEIALEAKAVCGNCPAAEDLLTEESLALIDLGRIEEAAVRADTLAAMYADGASAPSVLRAVADAQRARDGTTDRVLARYENLVRLFPESPEAFEVRSLLRELKEIGSRVDRTESGRVG